MSISVILVVNFLSRYVVAFVKLTRRNYLKGIVLLPMTHGVVEDLNQTRVKFKFSLIFSNKELSLFTLLSLAFTLILDLVSILKMLYSPAFRELSRIVLI